MDNDVYALWCPHCELVLCDGHREYDVYSDRTFCSEPCRCAYHNMRWLENMLPWERRHYTHRTNRGRRAEDLQSALVRIAEHTLRQQRLMQMADVQDLSSGIATMTVSEVGQLAPGAGDGLSNALVGLSIDA